MLQGFRNMDQKQDKKKVGDKNDAQSVVGGSGLLILSGALSIPVFSNNYQVIEQKIRIIVLNGHQSQIQNHTH